MAQLFGVSDSNIVLELRELGSMLVEPMSSVKLAAPNASHASKLAYTHSELPAGSVTVSTVSLLLARTTMQAIGASHSDRGMSVERRSPAKSGVPEHSWNEATSCWAMWQVSSNWKGSNFPSQKACCSSAREARDNSRFLLTFLSALRCALDASVLAVREKHESFIKPRRRARGGVWRDSVQKHLAGESASMRV